MLNDLYRQSWLRFLFAVVTGLLSGLAGAGLVSVISDCASSAAPVRTLAPLFFLICIVQVLCKSSSQIALMGLTQEAVYRLRVELCRKVLAMPYKKLEEMGKARLLAILTTDITTYTNAAQLMPSIFSNGIVIVVCLCYVALMSWKIFFCLALLLALGTSGYSFASRWPTRQMHKAREQIDVLFMLFRSLLEGARELQLNASRAGHFIDQVVDPSAKRFRSLYVRAMVGYTFFDNLGGALFFLVIGLLLFVMPIWLPQPPNVMITLTFLLLYLISPVGEVMAALPSVRQSEIALERIRQLEAELTVGRGEPVGHPFVDPFSHPVSGAPLLRFEAVCHNFPGLTEDKPFVLGPIDLSVERGELLFIVGGNGSGKTTLAMLLLGLYAPEQGSIVLNGVGVDRMNIRHYRQYFSAVFSDFHLFDEILCGDQREIATKATNYLEKLGLAHKVRIESSRFSTTSLSLGQRKRMALVSSYLEDRPIYLFDEWAADQDPAFKRVFYTELLPELKRAGKTVFVISHDDTYFHCADRIVKLAEGKLIINRAPSERSDVGIIQSASLA